MNCQSITLTLLRDPSSPLRLSRSTRCLVQFSSRATTTSTRRKLQQQASHLFICSSYSTASRHPEEGEQPEHQQHADLRSQLPFNHLVSPLSSSPQPSTAFTGINTLSSMQNSDTTVKKEIKNNIPRRTSYLRPCIYVLFFFAIGTLTGNFVCNIVIPPILPEPGSREDNLMIDYLHTQAEKLPLVRSLISDELWTEMDINKIGIESQNNGSSSNSIETDIEMKNQMTLDEDLENCKKRRLTLGPLAGSRAIGGYQKIFRNLHTGEIINIIWLGAAVSGWPGVTHGGLLATILDETLGRCAMGFLEGNTGVTANLELNYLKPVLSNGFYIIRTMPVSEEGRNEIKKSPVRKQWVTGSLESTTGMTCVKAKALFVVPKQYKLKN